jgi:hypothetical protein
LTDGNLTGTAPLPAGTTGVDIALPTATPAELVVVRGCGPSCTVATSADGTTFADVGTVSADFGALALPSAPITDVRIIWGATAPIGLREVSMWGPAPPPLPAASPSVVDRLRASFGLSEGGHPGRTVLAVVAAFTAAVVLMALGYFVGRRRVVTQH